MFFAKDRELLMFFFFIDIPDYTWRFVKNNSEFWMPCIAILSFFLICRFKPEITATFDNIPLGNLSNQSGLLTRLKFKKKKKINKRLQCNKCHQFSFR